MRTATAITRPAIPTVEPRQALRLDFHSVLAGRNFARAVEMSYRLDTNEEHVRRIRRDALKWLIVKSQNFDAAARLCADYASTTEEFAALIDGILKRNELTWRRTFTMRSGNPARLSVAEQIHEFVQRQIETMKKCERRRSHRIWWKRLLSAVKSWLGWRPGLRMTPAQRRNK